ncbi:MAG: hypothetical protein K1W13_07905 [Lachnospiraceae bacterium]
MQARQMFLRVLDFAIYGHYTMCIPSLQFILQTAWLDGKRTGQYDKKHNPDRKVW